MVDYKKQGKKNRQSGAAFERLVRKDLESKGWIVDKWSNNVEIIARIDKKDIKPTNLKELFKPETILYGKLIPAKRKYNPFNKALAIGTGFPDFIAFRDLDDEWNDPNIGYREVTKELPCREETIYDNPKEVIGVECKVNGYLTKEEKEKCKWLLENNIFSKILIASKKKVGRKIEIEYKDFI